MAAQYPIRAVAKLTGLGLDTLRAWERRYEAVRPARGERGRIYRDADIQRLRLLRSAVESGHAIGQIAALSNTQLAELAKPAVESATLVPALSEPLPELMKMIESYDLPGLTDRLVQLALLLPTAQLVHHVILPLMRLVGDRWEAGQLQIAQEHLLSGAVRSLLGTLMSRQVGAKPGRIVFATPAGELHEFGILAAALLAAAQGFQVVYLGPNLPAEEIATAVKRVEARAVVLGMMKPAAAEVKQVRQKVGCEVWVGGPGSEEARGVLPLRDLAELEQRLDQLMPVS